MIVLAAYDWISWLPVVCLPHLCGVVLQCDDHVSQLVDRRVKRISVWQNAVWSVCVLVFTKLIEDIVVTGRLTNMADHCKLGELEIFFFPEKEIILQFSGVFA